MSALLDAVSHARELRDRAEREFRAALVRAAREHSLREIGRAAGLSFTGVRWLIQRYKETERGEHDPS